ncbi:MAG: DUF6443 domain-containing protein, partial [Bacteroidota bacterium]
GTYYLRARTSTGCWSTSRGVAVTVNAYPGTPGTPSISGNTCGNKVVTRPSVSGATVYWQTTSSGTVTTDQAASKTLTTSGTLYLRARTSAGCWSSVRTVNVTVNQPSARPPAPAISTNSCGDRTATRPTVSGATVYWVSGSNGEETTDAAPTKVISASGQHTLYVRARTAAGCWSAANSATFTVNQPPATPAVSVTPDTRFSDQTRLTRGVAPSGVTFYWQEEESGTSQDDPGETYTAYVSKNVYLRAYQNGCWSAAQTIPVTVTFDPFINGVTSSVVLKEGVTDPMSIAALEVVDKAESSSFMDGLGRTIQTVAWQASPEQKDVVHATTYDHRGRVQKSYLPYVSTENDGNYRAEAIKGTYINSEQYQFYQHTANIAHDTQPYAETEYEHAPMSRVLEQGAMGADWGLASGKTTKGDFRVATQAVDGSIYRWRLHANLPTTNGTYANGTLTVSEVTDADNHMVWTYTDKVGKTILKRAKNGSEDRYTYYVYNDRDQLAYIIPPKEAYEITGGTAVTPTYAATRLYHYTYDERGRTRTKETPDAGEVRFVYDQYDRVVLTQDANQRAKTTPEWSFVTYDALSRPITSGIYATNTSWATLQSEANTNGHVREVASGAYDFTDVFPTTTATDVLSITYYDRYDVDTLSQVSYATTYDAAFSKIPVPDLNVHGRATHGLTRVLGTDDWLHTVSFFDEYGRVIQVQSYNHQGGTDVMTMEYDFAGRLLKAIAHYDNPRMEPHAEDLTVTRSMVYDHAGRLLALDHQVNGQEPVRLVAYKYNELGQVISKGLHGAVALQSDLPEDLVLDSYDGSSEIVASKSVTLQSGFATGDTGNNLKVYANPVIAPTEEIVAGEFQQKVDYTYNIRGWLKAINDAQLASENDYFGLELLYNDAANGHQQYNGTIGEVKWKGAQDEVTKSYRYQYDALSQLTEATYGENDSFTANTFGARGFAYDRNGNIQKLKRNGLVAGEVTQVDDLNFTYLGNQLEAVDDLESHAEAFHDRSEASDEYDYDANGNLIKDLNKEMTRITYNYLDLAEEVTFSDGRKVKYGYSADGQLLWQEFYGTNQSLKLRRDFLGSQVYEDSTLVSLQTEEGRIRPVTASGSAAVSFDYQYDLKDHQGNTRVTFSTTPENYTLVEDYEDETSSFSELKRLSRQNANSSTGGSYVSALSEGQTSSMLMIGLNKGDTVNLSVQANYEADPTDNTFLPLAYNALFRSFDAAFGGPEGIQSSASTFNDALSGANMAGKEAQSTAPRAFINFIFFDKDMEYKAAGFKQVSTVAIGVGVHELVQLDAPFVANQEGYLLAYLSNENQEALNVHFDDFTVYHGKTNIVQANDYYPFGLSSNTYTRTASTFNPYLYNQGSRLEEETEWYHTPFRKYDASIGRFTGVDAMASSMASINSYHYAYNNPVNLSDPTGLMPNSPPSPSGMGLSAEDKRRGGRGGGGFRVPGFSGMGGGRMGWSNGTGFNADGSSRYAAMNSFWGVQNATNNIPGFNLSSSGLSIDFSMLASGSYSFSFSKGKISGVSSASLGSLLAGTSLIAYESQSLLFGNKEGTSFSGRESNSISSVLESTNDFSESASVTGDQAAIDLYADRSEDLSTSDAGSYIPVLGSAADAVKDYQNGDYGWAAFNTAMAISDVFLVGSIVKGIGKGIWKTGSHSWRATRRWLGKKGYAKTGQPVHHWAVSQATAKKYGIEAFTNQPWNLKTFTNQSIHMRAGHGVNYLGQPGYNIIGRLWYGTPIWPKAFIFSYGGRTVQSTIK